MSVLTEYLKGIPPEHQALVKELDGLIRETAPDLIPSLKWGNLTYHSKRNACALINHKGHVNLQVWGGAGFDDPTPLLQGTGKGMRHIRLVAGATYDRSALAAIIQQAAGAARA